MQSDSLIVQCYLHIEKCNIVSYYMENFNILAILLSTGSTQEDPPWHNWNIVDWDVKNQIKQTNQYSSYSR